MRTLYTKALGYLLEIFPVAFFHCFIEILDVFQFFRLIKQSLVSFNRQHNLCLLAFIIDHVAHLFFRAAVLPVFVPMLIIVPPLEATINSVL